MDDGAVQGDDIIEICKPAKIGVQMVRREVALERRPARVLGGLLFALSFQEIDPGCLPGVQAWISLAPVRPVQFDPPSEIARRCERR
jgi:hypothetical protein